jgi:hypothetical protein
MNSIVITGQTTKTGRYGFYNIAQLDDFAKKNPEKNLIVTIQVEDKQSKNGLLAYYHAKVLPMWVDWYYKQGIIKNTVEMDVEIRSLCPLSQIKSLSDFTYEEMVQFMDQVKVVTVEHINEWIEEPRVL